jgi:hypothetical protein
MLVWGCGSDPLEQPGAAGGAAGAGGSAPQCDEPQGYASTHPLQFVGSVDATVRDLDGNAPTDLLVQVCGINKCISGASDSSGNALVSVNDDLTRPAFKYGDGLTYGKVALLLAEPSDMVALGTLSTPALPSSGSPITAGAIASSGGAELTVAPGASIAFDSLTYRTADEKAFRAAELPLAQAPAALDQGLGLELYVALAPLDTEFCPPATLALANSPGWSPGTPVEFYTHGLDVGEVYAPYGGFAKFADGAVSDDGAQIRAQDQTLSVLSLVAVRRRN